MELHLVVIVLLLVALIACMFVITHLLDRLARFSISVFPPRSECRLSRRW